MIIWLPSTISQVFGVHAQHQKQWPKTYVQNVILTWRQSETTCQNNEFNWEWKISIIHVNKKDIFSYITKYLV